MRKKQSAVVKNRFSKASASWFVKQNLSKTLNLILLTYNFWLFLILQFCCFFKRLMALNSKMAWNKWFSPKLFCWHSWQNKEKNDRTGTWRGMKSSHRLKKLANGKKYDRNFWGIVDFFVSKDRDQKIWRKLHSHNFFFYHKYENFSIFARGRCLFQLSGFEATFIKSFNRLLCKRKYLV